MPYNKMIGDLSSLLGISAGFLAIIVIISIWDIIWKGIGMWKSGRNNQLAWFICILIFNTVGILPIIYLAFFQRKQKQQATKKKRR